MTWCDECESYVWRIIILWKASHLSASASSNSRFAGENQFVTISTGASIHFSLPLKIELEGRTDADSRGRIDNVTKEIPNALRVGSRLSATLRCGDWWHEISISIAKAPHGQTLQFHIIVGPLRDLFYIQMPPRKCNLLALSALEKSRCADSMQYSNCGNFFWWR